MYARVVLRFVTLKNENGVYIDNFPKGKYTFKCFV